MKRTIFVILLLNICFFSFAKSDLCISGAFDFFRKDFSKNNIVYHAHNQNDFQVFVSNYNYLGKQKLFGFFEQIGFVFGNHWAFDAVLGPSFNFYVNDYLSFQPGAFIELFINEYDETTSNEQRTFNDFLFGFGTDIRFKFLCSKLFSPCFGFQFKACPLYYSFEDKGNTIIYDKYTEHWKISLSPYIGISFNFN